MPIKWCVFTKPWKVPIPELGRLVSDMGFGGVELPTRPGYPVPPEKISTGLSEAVRQLGEFGLEVPIITGRPDMVIDESVLSACRESGVKIIKTLVRIEADGYMATIARKQKEYEALVPLLDQYGITLGIQNHSGEMVCNAMGLRHLVSPFEPQHVAGIWDPAHCALEGETPSMAVDIIGEWMCAVYLKNAIYRQTSGPEAEVAQWSSYWTGGRYGLCDWAAVAGQLRQRSFEGPICLHPEYSDSEVVDRQIREDLAYAKKLFI